MKRVIIFREELPLNPRTEMDNFGVIAYKSNRHQLGDEKIDDPIDWLCQKLGFDDLEDYNEQRQTSYQYHDSTLSKLEGEFLDQYIALPVYKYEHGGVKLSTGGFSCPWDSGQIGYIYVPEDHMKEVNSWDESFLKGRTREETAHQLLRAEIEMFDQYINGEVYGFRVEDVTTCPCCGQQNFQVLDSMGGFFGDDFMNNGMAYYLSENGDELVEQLKEYSYQDIEDVTY